jgi:hypothetical protein
MGWPRLAQRLPEPVDFLERASRRPQRRLRLLSPPSGAERSSGLVHSFPSAPYPNVRNEIHPHGPRIRICGSLTSAREPVPATVVKSCMSWRRAQTETHNSRRPQHSTGIPHLPSSTLSSKREPPQQTGARDHRVRRDKIDSFGHVTLRYLGRLRHIPIGTAHKNRSVRLLVAGPEVRIVTDDGQMIRALTLDPTRNYKPLRGRWPPRNVLQQAGAMS